MQARSALTLTAGVVLLIATASSARARANVEGGGWVPSFDLGNLTDSAETLFNIATETDANVNTNTAQTNIAAFLAMVRHAEGTAQGGNPYAVCFGYKHTIGNFADHPAITGEWRGEKLPDAMCKNAGFGPGCVSTAAGAYQIIRPTWTRLKNKLGLPDFGPQSQDAAAVQLIADRGALEDVKGGRIVQAIEKCRNEWASLPGNFAKQGQRSQGQLIAWFQQSGGYIA